VFFTVAIDAHAGRPACGFDAPVFGLFAAAAARR